MEKLTKRFVSAKPDFLQVSHQEQSNRRIGPRESDGRFIKSPSKQKRKLVIESDSGQSETAARHFWWTTRPKQYKRSANHASFAKYPVRTLGLTCRKRKQITFHG